LRDPFNDKEAGRLVRQKLRERMNPKLGKIDIDYEVLHNAFFKFQEKPNMSRHGDVYYEGKEDEVKMNSYRPGKLSESLRVNFEIWGNLFKILFSKHLVFQNMHQLHGLLICKDMALLHHILI